MFWAQICQFLRSEYQFFFCFEEFFYLFWLCIYFWSWATSLRCSRHMSFEFLGAKFYSVTFKTSIGPKQSIWGCSNCKEKTFTSLSEYYLKSGKIQSFYLNFYLCIKSSYSKDVKSSFSINICSYSIYIRSFLKSNSVIF